MWSRPDKNLFKKIKSFPMSVVGHGNKETYPSKDVSFSRDARMCQQHDASLLFCVKVISISDMRALLKSHLFKYIDFLCGISSFTSEASVKHHTRHFLCGNIQYILLEHVSVGINMEWYTLRTYQLTGLQT